MVIEELIRVSVERGVQPEQIAFDLGLCEAHVRALIDRVKEQMEWLGANSPKEIPVDDYVGQTGP